MKAKLEWVYEVCTSFGKSEHLGVRSMSISKPEGGASKEPGVRGMMSDATP